MKRVALGAVAVACLSLTGCVVATDSDEDVGTDEGAVTSLDTAPTGKGAGVLKKFQKPNGEAKPGGGGKPTSNGINYHGGPVMTSPSGNKLYYIWYGNWSGNSATTILPDFASHLGGSPYWNINTTYTDASGAAIVNALTYGGSTTVAYPYGTSLSDAQIQAVVSNAITGGALPSDANGIYFVLTSADVTASSGFCTQYCGWHTHATIGGKDAPTPVAGEGKPFMAEAWRLREVAFEGCEDDVMIQGFL